MQHILSESKGYPGFWTLAEAQIRQDGQARIPRKLDVYLRLCASASALFTCPGRLLAVEAGVLRAEAWLSRRVDEIYRQLTREPVDDKLEARGRLQVLVVVF